jgi:hypothetical protein
MTKSIIVRTSCCWQEVFDMKKLHMTINKLKKTNVQKNWKMIPIELGSYLISCIVLISTKH